MSATMLQSAPREDVLHTQQYEIAPGEAKPYHRPTVPSGSPPLEGGSRLLQATVEDGEDEGESAPQSSTMPPSDFGSAKEIAPERHAPGPDVSQSINGVDQLTPDKEIRRAREGEAWNVTTNDSSRVPVTPTSLPSPTAGGDRNHPAQRTGRRIPPRRMKPLDATATSTSPNAVPYNTYTESEAWAPSPTENQTQGNFVMQDGYGSPTIPMSFGGPPEPYQPAPQMGGVHRMNVGMQHLSPSIPPSRYSGPSQINMPMNMDRPPLSGYQLLAAKITGGMGGTPINPIYRRFESLNHRLLLCLQDEIAELEEQLHGLDAADTKSRQHFSGIYPASRRYESMSPSELNMKTRDILGTIGFKIGLYNQIMSSFTGILKLPAPGIQEIHDYRAYLATTQPVVAEETKFLDAADDLISLPRPPGGDDLRSEELKTPVPGDPRRREDGRLYDVNGPQPVSPPKRDRETMTDGVRLLVMGTLVCISLPILVFVFVPDFASRMAVVIAVAAVVGMALMQSVTSDLFTGQSGLFQCIACAGVYGGVMAVIAGGVL